MAEYIWEIDEEDFYLDDEEDDEDEWEDVNGDDEFLPLLADCEEVYVEEEIEVDDEDDEGEDYEEWEYEIFEDEDE